MMEQLANLLNSVGFMGFGIAFGIIGMILGVTREMNKKNTDTYGITFGTISWIIALLIKENTIAMTVFIMGLMAIILSGMPILRKVADTNIMTLSTISMVIFVMISLGSGIFMSNIEQMDKTNLVIDSTIDNMLGNAMNKSIGLETRRWEVDCDLTTDANSTCSRTLVQDQEESILLDLFDPILSIIKGVSMIVNAVITGFKAIITPSIMTYEIMVGEDYESLNWGLRTGLFLLVATWQAMVIAKIGLFAIGRRGAK